MATVQEFAEMLRDGSGPLVTFALGSLCGWYACRRKPRVVSTAPELPPDWSDAKLLLDELHELARNTAIDVGKHSTRVGAANERLATAAAEGTQTPEVVSSVTAEILEANRRLQDELQQARRQLQEHKHQIKAYMVDARTDPLAGISNRRAFDESLADHLGRWRAGAAAPCLVMVDVDHFKQFNDRFGHLAGDEVLRNVAQLLDAVVGRRGLVARYGGEEFAFILGESDFEQAKQIAEEARELIASTKITFEDQRLSVTASLGLAQAINRDEEASFICRADEALYAAKHNGRNRTYYHDGETCRPVKRERVDVPEQARQDEKLTTAKSPAAAAPVADEPLPGTGKMVAMKTMEEKSAESPRAENEAKSANEAPTRPNAPYYEDPTPVDACELATAGLELCEKLAGSLEDDQAELAASSDVPASTKAALEVARGKEPDRDARTQNTAAAEVATNRATATAVLDPVLEAEFAASLEHAILNEDDSVEFEPAPSSSAVTLAESEEEVEVMRDVPPAGDTAGEAPADPAEAATVTESNVTVVLPADFDEDNFEEDSQDDLSWVTVERSENTAPAELPAKNSPTEPTSAVQGAPPGQAQWLPAENAPASPDAATAPPVSGRLATAEETARPQASTVVPELKSKAPAGSAPVETTPAKAPAVVREPAAAEPARQVPAPAPTNSAIAAAEGKLPAGSTKLPAAQTAASESVRSAQAKTVAEPVEAEPGEIASENGPAVVEPLADHAASNAASSDAGNVSVEYPQDLDDAEMASDEPSEPAKGDDTAQETPVAERPEAANTEPAKEEADKQPERRSQARLPFVGEQFVAPYVNGKVPPADQFRKVQCQELSQTGFSFYSRLKPSWQALILRLNPGPKQQDIVAKIVHCTKVSAQHEPTLHVVGCTFVEPLAIAEKDRRRNPRRPLNQMQAIARYADGQFPKKESFVQVRCRDISTTGFSFFSPRQLSWEKLVLRLGDDRNHSFLLASVVHATKTELNGRKCFVIGCCFVGRIDPSASSASTGTNA